MNCDKCKNYEAVEEEKTVEDKFYKYIDDSVYIDKRCGLVLALDTHLVSRILAKIAKEHYLSVFDKVIPCGMIIPEDVTKVIEIIKSIRKALEDA